MVSCGQFITRMLLLCPQAPLLFQYRTATTGYSPLQTSPTWILLRGCSFAQTALTWVLSKEYIFSGKDCIGLGLLWDTVPARNLLQERLCTHRIHSAALTWGHPQAVVWISVPWHGLLHSLQEYLFWHLGHSHFFMYLGIYRVASLTHSHSSLSGAVAKCVFLNILSQRHYHHCLTSLAMDSGGSVFELPGIGFVSHGGRFCFLLLEATPAAIPSYQNLSSL